MIPTMIVFGVLCGRWWALTLVLAAILWPALLVASGVMGPGPGLLGAAGLGAANAAVGVLIHQAVLWALRRIRSQKPRS